MKNYLLAFAFGLLSFSVSAQHSDDIVGYWFNGSKEAKIKVFKSGEFYYGSISWLKNPLNEKGEAKMDKNNPDPKMRTKPVKGLLILKGFRFDEKDKIWTDGRIYDPKNGKEYSCHIKMNGNQLNVRGYVGVSLIGRTDTWEKTTE